MPSKREQMRARKRAQQQRTIIIAILIGVALVAAAGYVIWKGLGAGPNEAVGTQTNESGLGQAVPPLADRSHVQDGTDPGPYNSDPPTSGRHYAEPAAAGFYDTDPYSIHPEGHLVHSLEHGYVIFWYNCDLLNEGTCADLKAQVKDVMAGADNFKVIAFPWPSLDVPVVMTSWGRLMKMQSFDPQKATAFVETFRGKAPEPDAP